MDEMSCVGKTAVLVVLATAGLFGTSGCAGSIEVTRTFAPTAASRVSSDKLEAVAVVRGETRIPIPRGSRVEADRVVLPVERVHIHKLVSGDVIEQDSAGRIVAVRSASDPPVYTRFVPGTAVSPAGSDDVRGEVEGTPTIELRASDSIEMRGHIAPDEPVPGGGRVESTRSTWALISGGLVLALSYAPTAYIGAASSRSADQALEVPIVGPWLDLAQRPACVAPVTPIKLPVDPCIEESASRAALITSGIFQGIGAILTAVGLPSYSRLVESGDRGVAIVPTMGGATAIAKF
jgi:hypothetical protein